MVGVEGGTTGNTLFTWHTQELGAAKSFEVNFINRSRVELEGGSFRFLASKFIEGLLEVLRNSNDLGKNVVEIRILRCAKSLDEIECLLLSNVQNSWKSLDI